MDRVPVAVIGAGPYGLAVAAHLRSAGLPPAVFGAPMSFWTGSMPEGMLLRSGWDGSHIADPDGKLTLDEYEADTGRRLARPIPVDDFVDYGHWFADRVGADPDPRTVTSVDVIGPGLRLTLSDGSTLAAQSVVVATGIAEFAHIPPEHADLIPTFASHTSRHASFSEFAGKRVVVVGSGQSALESAALLHESGAQVEVVARNDHVHWLTHGAGSRVHQALQSRHNPVRRWLFPPSDIGPVGISLLVDRPALFTRIPTSTLRARVSRRALRPAGAQWLRSRLESVPLRTSTVLRSCDPTSSGLAVETSDGRRTEVDHLLLATGYAVDVARCRFLGPDLVRSLRRIDGYPVLSPTLESSVPGLYFTGATAMRAMGPIARFVAGTAYAAHAATRGIASTG